LPDVWVDPVIEEAVEEVDGAAKNNKISMKLTLF